MANFIVQPVNDSRKSPGALRATARHLTSQQFFQPSKFLDEEESHCKLWNNREVNPLPQKQGDAWGQGFQLLTWGLLPQTHQSGHGVRNTARSSPTTRYGTQREEPKASACPHWVWERQRTHDLCDELLILLCTGPDRPLACTLKTGLDIPGWCGEGPRDEICLR